MSDTKSEGWWAIVGQQRTDSLGIKLSVCKSCKTVKKMKFTRQSKSFIHLLYPIYVILHDILYRTKLQISIYIYIYMMLDVDLIMH